MKDHKHEGHHETKMSHEAHSDRQHAAVETSTPVQLSNPLSDQASRPLLAPASTPMIADKPNRDRSALYTPAAIIVAAIIIGLGLYFGLAAKGGGTDAQTGQQPPANADISKVDISGHPFIGKGNAPVVVAYWFDYQCPFCKAFDTGGVPQITTQPALPDLIKNYVNTGKVKIVFFDYPFLGNDSITAAEYAHAVWDLYPSQWFAWHEAMYKAQDEEGDQGFGNAKSIDQLIKGSFPQMDDGKIQAQVAAHKADYDKAMQNDRAIGSAQGISGTPGFVIGTTLISGAEAYSTFTAAIDPLLK